jgi:hypothetical protein
MTKMTQHCHEESSSTDESSTKSEEEKSIETKVAELRQLFGPPPVLKSENVQAYDELLARLLRSHKPRSYFQEMWIKQLADCEWEINRYMRYTSLSMERRFRARIEFQEQRQNAAANQNKGAPANRPDPPTAPEELLAGLAEEVDAILLEPAAELDHFRALEVGIVYHGRLDKARNAAILRRNAILEQYQRYSDGLDKAAGAVGATNAGPAII